MWVSVVLWLECLNVIQKVTSTLPNLELRNIFLGLQLHNVPRIFCKNNFLRKQLRLEKYSCYKNL